MDWRETMQRMLVRMEEAGQWPAVCEEARAVLEAENEPSREPAAYLWGGCLWRTDEMERGRPGAAELYRAQGLGHRDTAKEPAMIKYFCDCCGDEIAERDTKERNPLARLTAKLKRGNAELQVEVIETKNGTSNAGQFCRYCVIDALRELDDRPTAA